MTRRFHLILSSCFLWLLVGVVAVAEVEWSGYVKSFSVVTIPPAIEGGGPRPPAEGFVSDRLRLRSRWSPSEAVSFDVAYALLPRVRIDTEAVGIVLPRPEPLTYRATDVRERLYPSAEGEVGSFQLYQNLDRLAIHLTIPFADVSIGRQPVAFGSARVVNPTDLFAPFTYEALDKEERIGVDAVRVRVPLGDFSELDAGVVFGDRFRAKESAAFVRGAFPFAGMDVALLAVRFRGNTLVGGELARTVGGATTWLEAAFTRASTSDENYGRLSAGFDYMVRGRLYTMLEYHWNGAGTDSPERYFLRAERTAYRDGGVYLLGRHYAALGLSYEVTPLMPASLQALVNLSDGSMLWVPRVEYNFAEDVYVEAGAFLGIGKTARLLGPETLVPGSEFGLYGSTLFASVRLYF